MAGLYYEEFQIGQKIVTVGRTIAEGDIMTFAGLSGDYNQIHTDADFSSKSYYGQRIAHGLLGLSVTSGLAMRTGVLEGTVIAFREISGWKFTKPVFIGDTIHAELTVTDCKPYPRLNGGSVSIDFDVRNQKNETVMKGTWTVIVASRPQ